MKFPDRKKTMGDRTRDIFDHEEEGKVRRSQKRNTRKWRIVAAPKRKERWETRNQTKIHGIRNLKTLGRSQRILHERYLTVSVG